MLLFSPLLSFPWWLKIRLQNLQWDVLWADKCIYWLIFFLQKDDTGEGRGPSLQVAAGKEEELTNKTETLFYIQLRELPVFLYYILKL